MIGKGTYRIETIIKRKDGTEERTTEEKEVRKDGNLRE